MLGKRRRSAYLLLALMVLGSFYARSGVQINPLFASIGVAEALPDFIPGLPIDINRATVEDLKTLPGIGEKTAQKIVNKRDSLGRFKAIEDLMLVQGIGPKTVERISSLVSIDSAEDP
jgi:competence ComEA-like helix-hairpin-helix protein